MPDQCDICRGSRVVRLPIYRHAIALADSMPDVEESSRLYPCPECGGDEPIERVHVVESHTRFIVPDGAPDDVRVTAIRSAVNGLVQFLMERKFIRIRKDHPITSLGVERSAYIATLAVASREDAVRIEDRIKVDRERFGKAVVDAAISRVNNWGSYYGHSEISKSVAGREIAGAIEDAKRAFELKDIER